MYHRILKIKFFDLWVVNVSHKASNMVKKLIKFLRGRFRSTKELSGEVMYTRLKLYFCNICITIFVKNLKANTHKKTG